MIHRFKIDEKSLWYGIFNDLKGQTATISTPLNQSKNPAKWHNDILALEKLGISKDISSIPLLQEKCLRKSTSKADAVIDYFFEFKNLSFDGRRIECPSSFGMFIKRETSETIKKRNGKGETPNTHLGRKKLHYQIGLFHKSDGFNIDNKAVLESILSQNGGFAYVVRGFEYDDEHDSLNFITSIVGVKDIPLSTVFRRKKGVGKKLIVNNVDLESISYDFPPEILMLLNSKKEATKKSQDDVLSTFEAINKKRIENGKKGEEYMMKVLKDAGIGGDTLYHASKDYPTSPYDIEYEKEGKKYYVEVKSTSSDKIIFNMSEGELKFMKKYEDTYFLYLITNVNDEFPTKHEFKPHDLDRFHKSYPTTRFEKQRS